MKPARSRSVVACGSAVAVVAGTILVLSPWASGSTPNAGTVDSGHPSVTWTGGPFPAPNVTGTAGDVNCTVPQSCDDFSLTVNEPAGTGDTQELKITVSWPDTAADFDVYVLDRSGTVVGESASSADPETVVLLPDSGTYTVRVVPFTPLADSYTATAAVVAKPSDTAPASNAPAPTFSNYPAPSSFSDADSAGEPSIGYSSKTGATVFQSSFSTYFAHFDDSTTPAGVTWADKSASLTTGCPGGSVTSLDPIGYTDRVTGRVFESQLTGQDSLTCYTDNDGSSWSESQGGGFVSGVDHQTLGGGPYVANDPLNTANTYPRATYYCSQDIATAFCALSRDGGVTFAQSVPVYSLLDCGGLHGHVMVAPDGTAYLPNKSCGANQAVVVSKDDGKTWTVNRIPSSTPGDSDPAVGIGANGTVYFGYSAADGTPHVAVSTDKGTTWSSDYNVGASLGIKYTVFPTLVSGDDDRAAFSFLGTTTGTGNYQDPSFAGVWYLYTAYTYDGGKSWVTVNDTPNDPVQRGGICTAGTTCSTDRNLLDFIGSTIDGHGRVEVGYADGCINACVTDPSQNNRDAYATIARQSTGLPLFSAYDPLPNLVISNVSATIARSGSSTVSATMSNVGAAKATAPARIEIDGKTLLTSAAQTVAPGASVTVTAAWNTKGLKGTHTVLGVADPDNVVRESDEGDNKASTTVKL